MNVDVEDIDDIDDVDDVDDVDDAVVSDVTGVEDWIELGADIGVDVVGETNEAVKVF